MAVGDSKTRSPGTGLGGGVDWEDYLLSNLNALGTYTWSEIKAAHNRVAYGGYTAQQWVDAAPADLATIADGTTVNHILVNLGANDLVAGTSESAFKSAMVAAIALLKAKFPMAAIYLAKIWRRNYDAQSTVMNGWIGDVAVSESVQVGFNEEGWLKNGDDGVTYTYDGTHYNNAGNQLCAVQWQLKVGA